MSNESYGARMQAARAARALIERYFDPDTVEVGFTCSAIADDDGPDETAWEEARTTLLRRGLDWEESGDQMTIIALAADPAFPLG